MASPGELQKIGHGASGCVYRPAIPCTNGTRPEGYVAKLIQTKNLGREYKEDVVAKLEAIDPSQLKVIRPILPAAVCKGNSKNANIQTAFVNACTPFAEQAFRGEEAVVKDKTTVLYQKNAGSITLGDLIEDDYGPIKQSEYSPSQAVRDALEQSYAIEVFLLDNGLTHSDISFGNIMVLEDGSLRFIDTAGITFLEDRDAALTKFVDDLQNSKISVRFSNRTELTTRIAPFRAGLPSADVNESSESQPSTLTLSNYLTNSNNTNSNSNNNTPNKRPILRVGGRRRITKKNHRTKQSTKKRYLRKR